MSEVESTMAEMERLMGDEEVVIVRANARQDSASFHAPLLPPEAEYEPSIRQRRGRTEGEASSSHTPTRRGQKKGVAHAEPSTFNWVPDSRLVSLSQLPATTLAMVYGRLGVDERVLYADSPEFPVGIFVGPAFAAAVMGALVATLASLDIVIPAVVIAVLLLLWSVSWIIVGLRVAYTVYVLTDSRIMVLTGSCFPLVWSSTTLVNYEDVMGASLSSRWKDTVVVSLPERKSLSLWYLGDKAPAVVAALESLVVDSRARNQRLDPFAL